jgi:hypothetical protein
MPRRHRRPRWSLRSSFLAGGGILLACSLIVVLGLRESLWIELEIVSGLLGVLLWCFFTAVLYHGARFDQRERLHFEYSRGHGRDWWDPGTGIDTGGAFTEWGAEAGLAGAVLGFLLDLMILFGVSVVVGLLVWLGVNLVLPTILTLALPLFWLFRRAARTVVALGRRCRGRFWLSLGLGLRSALLSTFWLYTALYLGHLLARAWSR